MKVFYPQKKSNRIRLRESVWNKCRRLLLGISLVGTTKYLADLIDKSLSLNGSERDDRGVVCVGCLLNGDASVLIGANSEAVTSWIFKRCDHKVKIEA